MYIMLNDGSGAEIHTDQSLVLHQGYFDGFSVTVVLRNKAQLAAARRALPTGVKIRLLMEGHLLHSGVCNSGYSGYCLNITLYPLPIMSEDKQYAAVLHYHDRTKHQLNGYARSLGYMDWANQPDPFRFYEDSPKLRLPLMDQHSASAYARLYETDTSLKQPVTLSAIAAFLELSMGLSAWKKFGESEWSLRMNPSSGNLHPTECTLLLPSLDGKPACIAHYNPLLHCLEVRAELQEKEARAMRNFRGFGLILSSIYWREAWKYGERAFRYCNLDVGHALGALRFSANLSGWRLVLCPQAGDERLDRLLGFDRIEWPENEDEHADCLCWVSDDKTDTKAAVEWLQGMETPHYKHAPNRLSAEHQQWPIIQNTSLATRSPGYTSGHLPRQKSTVSAKLVSDLSAEQVIRRRRSAQSFDPQASRIGLQDFYALLERTLPYDSAPFDCLPLDPDVHLFLFIHQVEGLQCGLYALIRNPDHLSTLQKQLNPAFTWEPVDADLPLYLLQAGDYRSQAERISCQQAIAGDSAFSLAMVARFEPKLKDAPWRYPRLYWEAGLIGQVLYLEAEAKGLRGTGIGCFFDDAMHDLLGLKDHEWQDIYHFTVGAPREDLRVQTKPAYYHLTSALQNPEQ
jgi:SagB-type dehydrogenase family enzyme